MRIFLTFLLSALFGCFGCFLIWWGLESIVDEDFWVGAFSIFLGATILTNLKVEIGEKK